MGLPFLLTTVTVAHFSFSSFAMLLETEYVLTLRYFLTTCFAGRRMGALFALFIQPFFSPSHGWCGMLLRERRRRRRRQQWVILAQRSPGNSLVPVTSIQPSTWVSPGQLWQHFGSRNLACS
jgi:hypothetical protein